jgi:hypothetical protein
MTFDHDSPFVLDSCSAQREDAVPLDQLVPGSLLAAAVGQGKTNQPADVQRVQARLRELGMTWVPISGAIGSAGDDPTNRGIRLFLAMLHATQMWKRGDGDSIAACSEHPASAGAIDPGSDDERWLWAATAPRWLSSAPSVRDGWEPAANLNEPAMSSWLAEYLDQVGRAFRGKLAALRPVLATLVTRGPAGLDALRNPPRTPVGPPGPAEQDDLRTAAIAARVATDIVDLAAARRLDPVQLARDTLAAIDAGRAILTLSAVAALQGGCTGPHKGHQQGLECDFRLFAHGGPQSGLVFCTPETSRLLIGVAIDCFVENKLTRTIIYNDPAIRARVPSVSMDKGATGRSGCDPHQIHDNHVHVAIKGIDGHVLVPAGPAASGARGTVQMPVPGVYELAAPLTAPLTVPLDEGLAPAACTACGRSLAEADVAWEASDEVPSAARTYTIVDYLALVKKVEAAYPAWSPDDVLGALRRVAGCDNLLFQVLFGTSEGHAIKAGDGGLTPTDLGDLTAMSAHQGSGGTVVDLLQQKLAVGHVLCGLTAGQHRNQSVGLVGRWLAVALVQQFAGLTLDNLYATTIAGDLGQAAVRVHLKQLTALLGPGSEATDEELVGDIDGCVLGSRGGLGGRRVSDVLAAYYAAAPAGPGAVHASRRFQLFAPHAGAVLDDQTARFARAYLVHEAWSRAAESLDAEVKQALVGFRDWYRRQLAAEQARPAGAPASLSVPHELAWSAETSFEQLAPPYSVAVLNTDNQATSVSFSVDPVTATVAITIAAQTPTGTASNTMVLTGARKSASGSEVTGYARDQLDGDGGRFTAYLKLQVLPTEMVVQAFKAVGPSYFHLPGRDRHYRFTAAGAQASLLAFIATLPLGASAFEI